MNTKAYLFFLTLICLFSTTLKSLFIRFIFVSKLWYNKIFHNHSPPTLDDDIIFFHILNQLPPKSLLRFSCVSKLWYNTIHHDPFFIDSHFNHSKSKPSHVFISTSSSETHFINYLDDDQEASSSSHTLVTNFKKNWRKVIGSVNGLTCFKTVYSIEVCNTSTHEILGIPYPSKGDTCDTCFHGFGFDPLMNRYKVMRLTMLANKFICQIFTLGPKAQEDCIWRDITATSHLPNLLEWDIGNCKEPLIFSNGALFHVMPCTNTIIMFDIHYETFQRIPGLQIGRGDDDMLSLLYTICEFRGCPYAVYSAYFRDGYEFSFYALKKEEQASSSNSNSNSNVGSNIHFVFEQAVRFPRIVRLCVLLSFTEFSGQILVQWYDIVDNKIQFSVYNPHTEMLQKKEVSFDSYGYAASFVKHIDNLLSLKKLVSISLPGAPATTEVKYLSLREATMHDDEGSSTILSPISMLCCFGLRAKKHR